MNTNLSLNGFSFDINAISGTCLVSFGYPADENSQCWREFELDAEEAVNKFNQLYAEAFNTYGYPSEEHLLD